MIADAYRKEFARDHIGIQRGIAGVEAPFALILSSTMIFRAATRCTEPEHGRWTASGDFPVGQVRIILVDGSDTEHNVEYYDENSCPFDGVVTAVE